MGYSEIYNEFEDYCKNHDDMSKMEVIDRFLSLKCIPDIDVRDMLETAYKARKTEKKENC